MRELYIYADFDWLEEPELVGRLTYERLRGNGTYGFCFDKIWLKNHSDIILSEDISNFFGFQYSKEEHVFGFISDTLPDRWGTRLLNRKEQVEAKEQGRNAHTLYSYDYLRGVDDFTRMGALRFKETENGDYINLHTQLSIQPLTSVRELACISQEYEEADEKNELPEIKWIRQLEHPGTSLGGARPKANVTDEANNLWIAKFPSEHDTENAGAWEMVAHDLAEMCSLDVAEAQALSLTREGTTFLVKRFDRIGKARIHMASAMTMLDRTDRDKDSSYLDIADWLTAHSANAAADLREIWCRIVFNIAISNTDDHLRNHGFLLYKDGWHLSPLFDVNPNPYGNNLSLGITEEDSTMDMSLALETAEFYQIKTSDARSIIANTKSIVAENWYVLAKKYGLSPTAMERMSPAFLCE